MVSISAGEDLFGKVDRIKGVGYVATLCGHLCSLPIIPRQTYLILTAPGMDSRGIPIPFSDKSYLMAWARPLSFAIAFIGSIITAAAFSSPQHAPANRFMLAGITAAAWLSLLASIWLKPIRHASYKRACEIIAQAGLGADMLQLVAQTYGQHAIVPASTWQPPPTKEEAFQDFLEFAKSQGVDVKDIAGEHAKDLPEPHTK